MKEVETRQSSKNENAGSNLRANVTFVIILGINAAYHEPAAALLIDGRLVAAAEEERFNRFRHGWIAKPENLDLPWRAIDFCLNRSAIDARQVDFVAYSFEPNERFAAKWPGDRGLNLPVGAWGTREGEETFLKASLQKRSDLCQRFTRAKFQFFRHHECHAASAFFCSPFQHAAILVLDGIGEHSSGWAGIGTGSTISPFFEISYPSSIGFLWEKVSEFLGFSAYDGPGKVMALATHSDSEARVRRERMLFDQFVRLKSDSFDVDNSVLRYREPGFEGLENVFGLQASIVRDKKRLVSIASALQGLTQDLVVSLLVRLENMIRTEGSGTTNLCLAGGVALNCVMNSAIARRTNWRDIWAQPASHDAGTALGAAQLAWHSVLGRRGREELKDVFLGPDYSDHQCEAALLTFGFQYKRPQALEEYVARKLAENESVAWFQGRMEFGPRALGHRSILANPSNPNMRGRLNEKIKLREGYRPFAPTVSKADAPLFFDDAQSDSRLQPFMLTTNNALPAAVSMAPAALHHCNGLVSARLQTLEPQFCYQFSALLETFKNVTGCPMLINTSFNVREPIVASPNDACRTFAESGLDCLVLGPFVVERQR